MTPKRWSMEEVLGSLSVQGSGLLAEPRRTRSWTLPNTEAVRVECPRARRRVVLPCERLMICLPYPKTRALSPTRKACVCAGGIANNARSLLQWSLDGP
jgi:hypothetical protein